MAKVLKKGQCFSTKHTKRLTCYGNKEVFSSKRGILLPLLRFSLCCYTNPGPLSAVERYDGAKVSLHVASHTRSFPSFQGTIEIPSGLLPSDLATPEGSKRAGIFAADSALWMMSFKLECLEWRPSLHLQLRP